MDSKKIGTPEDKEREMVVGPTRTPEAFACSHMENSKDRLLRVWKINDKYPPAGRK